jgi:porin
LDIDRDASAASGLRHDIGEMLMTSSNTTINPAKHGRERTNAAGLLWCLLVGLSFVIHSNQASAQPVEVPPTWGGDILSRPRLTGDWGGLRDELGKKGIVLDVDLLLTPQVVMGGGRNTGGDFWGNMDYTLNVDTQKLGLWPGGFLKVSADTGFGSNAFQDAGTIVPVNTAALIPAPDDRTTALMNASLSQFLSPQFGVTAGKFNIVDAGETEFYGNYRTQFMNAAFNFPMTFALLPLSTFGGGVVVLPREDIVLSGLAIGPNGEPTSNDVGQAFHGVLILGNGKLAVRPFGLVGHQSLGFTWNNQNRFSLDQDPSISLTCY